MARRIYCALQDDAQAQAKIRKEHKAMSLNLATDPTYGFDVTSSTVNGQTFSGEVSMSNLDRHAMLSLIVNMFDAGQPLSNISRPYFS